MQRNAGLLFQQARNKLNKDAFSSFDSCWHSFYREKLFKRAAVPATIPFVMPRKPMQTFRACSSLVSLGQEFQAARDRWELLLRADQVVE